jgi:ATP-dependent helicase HrpA
VPAIDANQFPNYTTVGGNKYRLHYQFEPTHETDGITVDVPLAALAHLPAGAFDWHVQGWLLDKIVALIRTLPRGVRTKLVPAPAVAGDVARSIRFGEADFLATLADRLGSIVGEVIPRGAFNLDDLPPYLRMNIRVLDEGGRTLAASRDLAELKEKLAGVTRDAFKDLPASPWQKKDVKRWDFGDLPESISVRKPGITVLAYPTLVEDGERVDLRLLDSPEAAAREMRSGMRRLFMHQLSTDFKQIARTLPGWNQMALHYASLAPADTLRKSILLAVADEALFHDDESVVRTQAEFANRAAAAWKKLLPAANTAAAQAAATLSAYHALAKLLEQKHQDHHLPAVRDVRSQVKHLIPPDFAIATPLAWRPHLPRFARAAEMRLTKLRSWGAAKDAQLMNQVRPYWLRYADLIERKSSMKQDADVIHFRWMIEELRVGLFAQELKTSAPVSAQRLDKLWQAIQI